MGPDHTLKRVVKLFISILFCAGTWLLNVSRRMAGQEPRFGCVILYYHAIPAEYRKQFSDQLDTLLRLTRPIGIDSVPRLSPGIRYSSITFDDAFQSVIENALPELTRRDTPATLFVTTDVLGQRAAWWPADAREHGDTIASAEELQQLPTDLISIGSHTLTHPKLTSLSEVEARRELYQSRVRLEGLLKRKITTFSFPYGAFDGKLVEWCREAGYKRVFTTLPVAFSDPEEFVVGRVKADPTDWPLEFHLKVLGGYRWMTYAISLKRRVLSSPLLNRLPYSKAVTA
jgi:peptidoglycan/xylan/chitin deacetylase (PgdA/CDA1 family)